MEATGAYWKPGWHVLEGQVELVLANAQHIRNVPGRKTTPGRNRTDSLALYISSASGWNERDVRLSSLP
jgi:hypothetical protein